MFFISESTFDAYSAFNVNAPVAVNATESGRFYIRGEGLSTEDPDTPGKLNFVMSASWPSSLNAANLTKGQTISHWVELTHTVDMSIEKQIVSCNT
jgi:hypothetical protein